MDRRNVSKPAPDRHRLPRRALLREWRESDILCVLGCLLVPFARLPSVDSILLSSQLRASDPVRCPFPDHWCVLTSSCCSQSSHRTIKPSTLDRFSNGLLPRDHAMPRPDSRVRFPCTTPMSLTNLRQCPRSARRLTTALRERCRLESASHHRDELPCKQVCSQSNRDDLS